MNRPHCQQCQRPRWTARPQIVISPGGVPTRLLTLCLPCRWALVADGHAVGRLVTR